MSITHVTHVLAQFGNVKYIYMFISEGRRQTKSKFSLVLQSTPSQNFIRIHLRHILSNHVNTYRQTDTETYKRKKRQKDNLVIIRPHRRLCYSNSAAAYCYTRSSVVCLSVGHVRELCKNRWTDRDAVWDADWDGPKESCIRGVFRSPTGRDTFQIVRPTGNHCNSELCNSG